MKLPPEPPIRGKKMTSRQVCQQHSKLLRVRAALWRRIRRLAEDASEDRPGYSVHMADAGTDSFDRDLTLGLASFEQEALYEVDAALRRLDDGSYGICELTGKPIPWKRLRAIPWTRFSIEAELELETLGAHPHIGSLGTIQPVSEGVFMAPFDQQLENLSQGSTEELSS
jgi:RNA polymerase-binding transcription factor DksA